MKLYYELINKTTHEHVLETVETYKVGKQTINEYFQNMGYNKTEWIVTNAESVY